jgi:D-alanine-D-alanine ligase
MSLRSPRLHTASMGLVYELHDAYPRRPGDPPDCHVEYEPEATLLALEAAIERLGQRPVRLGRPHDLLEAASKGGVAVDAALSIAEGYGSRNREAWAPVLLEMLGVPQLGSDALTLSLSLDKAWTRAVVADAGVPVAPGAVVASAEAARHLDAPGGFPCFVKPRWEGTAKGIDLRSRVETRAELVAAVARVVERYRQPALVEHFLPGAEYTVTVIGNDPPRALPVLQRALEAETRIGIHAVEEPGGGLAHVTPGALGGALEAELAGLAIRAYDALACRDFARADFKCDAAGRPVFLEINPLPTFAPDGSFGILAELMGRSHEDLLAEVLGLGLRRIQGGGGR